jgi:hypothetical protein
MCIDGCKADEAVVGPAFCTTGTPSTALPAGKFSTQNTTLAAAAHANKAAQAPGQSFSLRELVEICNMAGL